MVKGKGRELGCEVETKTGWHGPEFEFPTLRIPFRKQKFTNDRITFFVLNSGRTHDAVVSRQKLLKSPVVQVKNKMVLISDYFYEIALEDVEFVNLIANNKCGEALLPNDLAVSSSLSAMLATGENVDLYHYATSIAKNHIAALALLRCSIKNVFRMNSSLFIQTNLSPQQSPPRTLGFSLK